MKIYKQNDVKKQNEMRLQLRIQKKMQSKIYVI